MLNIFKKRKLERYKQMVRMEQLEKNVELANQRYDELSDAFKDALRYGHIVGMEYDEKGEPIFVARIVEMRQITIFISGKKKCSSYPKLYATLDRLEPSIHINDILGDVNEKSGSILMKYLFSFCDEISNILNKEIVEITGTISSVDRDHFDRIEHFYQKFGFDVKFNEDGTGGKIKLERKSQCLDTITD